MTRRPWRPYAARALLALPHLFVLPSLIKSTPTPLLNSPILAHKFCRRAIFWDTGCRLNEVLSARLADVDLDRGTLFCAAENRKGRRKDRIYPLHAQTIEAIRDTLPVCAGNPALTKNALPLPLLRPDAA